MLAGLEIGNGLTVAGLGIELVVLITLTPVEPGV
jgi:hypothetical protein